MRPSTAPLIAALALALPSLAPAAEKPVDPYVQSDSNAGVTPIRGDAVFKAFHGKAGIDRIVHRLNQYHHSDPRLSDLFHAADDARLMIVCRDRPMLDQKRFAFKRTDRLLQFIGISV